MFLYDNWSQAPLHVCPRNIAIPIHIFLLRTVRILWNFFIKMFLDEFQKNFKFLLKSFGKVSKKNLNFFFEKKKQIRKHSKIKISQLTWPPKKNKPTYRTNKTKILKNQNSTCAENINLGLVFGNPIASWRVCTKQSEKQSSNNCFNKPVGRELSFVQQTNNKIVTTAVAPTCCELANRGQDSIWNLEPVIAA